VSSPTRRENHQRDVESIRGPMMHDTRAWRVAGWGRSFRENKKLEYDNEVRVQNEAKTHRVGRGRLMVWDVSKRDAARRACGTRVVHKWGESMGA